MAKGRRIAIEKNIYRYEDSGILEAVVEVQGRPARRKRFAPDTPPQRIRAWVEAIREELRDDIRAFGALPAHDVRTHVGSLAVDAANYLEQITGRAGAAADRSHLRAWLAVVVPGESKPLGAFDRATITSSHINKVIALWRTAPSAHAVRRVRVEGYGRPAAHVETHTIRGTTVSPHERDGTGPIAGYERHGSTISAHTRKAAVITSYERAAPVTSGHVVAARTIRHRCRVLADLYHTLDGRAAPTPVDEAKVPSTPKTLPVTVPPEVIVTVLTELATRDPITHARFALVATTGQRPCQIGRATAEDVDLEGGVWVVRDAKLEPAHTIALTPAAIVAWRGFALAGAWGPFDTSKYGKVVHEAGWPTGVRPYAARHSIAKALIRLGISLGDVQAHLGHQRPETTRIYAPFEFDRQRTVSTALKDYLMDAFRPRLVKKTD